MGKVLIIEDSEAVVAMYERQFAHEGFTVVFAPDGVAGIAKAKSEKPDVILLDIVLPRKSGLEVLKELKAETKTKAIPVVAISAFGSEENKKQALTLGAVVFLEKELMDPAEVATVIKKAIS